MDFALGLLNRVSQGQKAAQEAERRRAESERVARAAAAAEKVVEEKRRMRGEADKLIDRNTRIRRRPIAKRRPSSAPPRPGESKQTIRRTPPQKNGGGGGKPRPKPTGPPKPLPGMEFVVRRNKKKAIHVPHTSDYSDMFGDEFSEGVELKHIKSTQEESAKASREAQRIHAERKELAAKLMKDAEKTRERMAEMQRRGLKPKDKHEWRRRMAENDWVVVAAPNSRPRSPTMSGGSGGRTGMSVSGVGGKGLEVWKGARGKPSKDDIAERSRALRERVMAATGALPMKPRGGMNGMSPKRLRGTDTEVPRKKSRMAELERPARKVGGRTAEPVNRCKRAGYGGRVEERYERGYNSEEWSDDGGDDDDDDDEDCFGIDVLEREEEESSWWAAKEDRQEFLKEKKRKKEKERRRRMLEGDSD